MRYGVMNSPLQPLLQEIEVLGELGFDYLEMTMDAPYAHFEVVERQKRQLLKALHRVDMDLVCHLPTFVSTADLTERIREASIQETLDSMRTAADLSALKVVLHPSFIHGLGAMLRDLAMQHAERAMARLLGEAERLNLTVCVENMFPSSLSLVRPEDFDTLFGRSPWAKLTLDTGHANIGGGLERILTFVQRFSERLGHLHISDNHGCRDDHLPIGAGGIDFPKVTAALKAVGYDDTITFEVFSKDRNDLLLSRRRFVDMLSRA